MFILNDTELTRSRPQVPLNPGLAEICAKTTATEIVNFPAEIPNFFQRSLTKYFFRIRSNFVARMIGPKDFNRRNFLREILQ